MHGRIFTFESPTYAGGGNQFFFFFLNVNEIPFRPSEEYNVMYVLCCKTSAHHIYTVHDQLSCVYITVVCSQVKLPCVEKKKKIKKSIVCIKPVFGQVYRTGCINTVLIFLQYISWRKPLSPIHGWRTVYSQRSAGPVFRLPERSKSTLVCI